MAIGLIPAGVCVFDHRFLSSFMVKSFMRLRFVCLN
jgi:hypothetical protein